MYTYLYSLFRAVVKANGSACDAVNRNKKLPFFKHHFERFGWDEARFLWGPKMTQRSPFLQNYVYQTCSMFRQENWNSLFLYTYIEIFISKLTQLYFCQWIFILWYLLCYNQNYVKNNSDVIYFKIKTHVNLIFFLFI